MTHAATGLLRADHRRIEEWLDRLLEALCESRRGALGPSFGEAHRLLEEHYARERAVFFPALPPAFAPLSAKMIAQHERARELARHVAALLDDAGARPSDLPRLAREFHAIAQHNIIEEERDFFPLVDRALGPAAQAELAERLAAAL